MVGGGEWAARDGLYPLIGQFGGSLNSRSASHRSIDMPKGHKIHLTTTGVNFRHL